MIVTSSFEARSSPSPLPVQVLPGSGRCRAHVLRTHAHTRDGILVGRLSTSAYKLYEIILPDGGARSGRSICVGAIRRPPGRSPRRGRCRANQGGCPIRRTADKRVDMSSADVRHVERCPLPPAQRVSMSIRWTLPDREHLGMSIVRSALYALSGGPQRIRTRKPGSHCLHDCSRKPGAFVMSTSQPVRNVAEEMRVPTSPAFTVDHKGQISPTTEVSLSAGDDMVVVPDSSAGYAGYVCAWRGECKCSEFVMNLSGEPHMTTEGSPYTINAKASGAYTIYATLSETGSGPAASGINGDVRIGSGNISASQPRFSATGRVA
jgi:hypothetical protein